jgi:adenylate kinase family enzyme
MISRIVVIGTSGSGKTTLAKVLASKLGIKHVELDALHWEPNWVEASQEETRRRADLALGKDAAWVVDGNYGYTRDIVWARAQLVVWLDYSFSVVFTRAIRRTFTRMYHREVLWSGNVERWSKLLSKDSILLWVIQTHHRRAKQYPILLQQPEFQHLKVVRLRTPREAAEWLKTIKPLHLHEEA